ncbi:MAG: arsenic efflux protein [Lachnospiraceae bacterium]|nr:arsenic efflux protein [Lachnospiraceae bacterium]
MKDVLLDTLTDALKLLPFLFCTYLVMEYLESRTEGKTGEVVRKAGWLGPLWGGLLGVVPQCGFSAAAANLYAGRVISVGTLLAIFLSTSDEMIPIMISEAAPVSVMLKILLVKALYAVAAGFVIDGVCHIRAYSGTGQAEGGAMQIERLCEKEKCHCEEGSIVRSALKHTLNIMIFVVLITLALNAAFYYVGEDRIMQAIAGRPVLGELTAALIGLIPNCGASVLLTQLYLKGIMSASQLIAGLLVGAGVGLLVLFRVNPDTKENIRITVLLYILGVAGGLMVWLFGISF